MIEKNTKIGDICELKYGKALKSENRAGGKYPVYGSSGIVGYHNEYLVDKPTLIIGRKGSVGEIYYSEVPCWPIDTAYYLEYDSKRINLKWFRNLLLTLKLKSLDKSAAIPGLNRNDVYNLKASIPSLTDQIRIANILSQAEFLISKREESIRLLDEFLKSIFLEMFGEIRTNSKNWQSDKLGNLYSKDSIVDGPFGSAINVKDDYIENGEIPIIRTVNIKRFNFSFDNLRFIKREKYEMIKRSNVKPGDILISKVGTIGNVCMFPDRYKEAVLSTTGSTRLRNTNPEINFNYLLYYLDVYKPLMIQMASTGVQPFLNLSHIKSFKVFLPPLKLQTQFAFIVEKAQYLKAHYQASSQQLENLYGSLSQRAFKGELIISSR